MNFNIELARFKRRLLEAERELEDCVAKLKDAKRFNREKDFLLFFDDELELEALERKLTSARKVETALNKKFRRMFDERYEKYNNKKIRGLNEVSAAFKIEYQSVLSSLIAEFKNDEAFEFWKKNVLRPYEPWEPWKQYHKEALVYEVNYLIKALQAHKAENERDFWDVAVDWKRSKIRVRALKRIVLEIINSLSSGSFKTLPSTILACVKLAAERDVEMMY